jgi:cytochrome c oxidase subunit IV
LFSGLILIRERKLLPILIVLTGNMAHGFLTALAVTTLVIWYRIESNANRWVQLKDVFGFFMLLVAAVTPEPVREFSITIGLVMLGFSFGHGLLGITPALLLLRQYQSQPLMQEIIFGSAGLTLAAVELVRWAKSKHQDLLILIFETIGTIGIFFGINEILIKWSDDIILMGIAAGLVVAVLIVVSWLKWRGDGFERFYGKLVSNLARFFSFGVRFISPELPFVAPQARILNGDAETAFSKTFTITVIVVVVLGLFALLGHGGGI